MDDSGIDFKTEEEEKVEWMIRGMRRECAWWELKRELRRRSFFRRPQKRRMSKSQIPYLELNGAARAFLNLARTLERSSAQLVGVKELPTADNINGVVAVIEVEHGDSYLLNLDKNKQFKSGGVRRWCFPGGGRGKSENLATTVFRELREENSLDLRHNVFKLVGLVPLERDPDLQTMLVFCRISQAAAARIRIRRGGEQAAFLVAPREQIDVFSSLGGMPQNHINYWSVFKEWQERLGIKQNESVR